MKGLIQKAADLVNEQGKQKNRTTSNSNANAEIEYDSLYVPISIAVQSL